MGGGSGVAPGGVQATAITEDATNGKLVYDPSHPDADAQGYVRMPNVDTVTEMVDLIDAQRAYEANVTAMSASKQMFAKTLEILRYDHRSDLRRFWRRVADRSRSRPLPGRRLRLGLRLVLGDSISARPSHPDRRRAGRAGLATGQADDPTAVVMAVERAQLSMQLASQIRNKAVEAAQDHLPTQV